MITATISHRTYVLNSLEDAEILLRIMANAKQVSRRYDSDTQEHTFVTDSADELIEVRVFNEQPILTTAEYAAKNAKKSATTTKKEAA